MDIVARELGISCKNIYPTASPSLFSAVVNTSWLQKWLKHLEIETSVNADISLHSRESVSHPRRKVFIRVLNKKVSKVLPLPRYKLNENTSDPTLSFSQLLQYVSQSNQRSLWKESYRKYCQNNEGNKESTIVNLLEHDQLITEVLLRLYGCSIIRIKMDSAGNHIEYREIVSNKSLKCYETHVNLLSALFTLETDNNFYVVFRGHYENTLLDFLNFSPNLIDMNYCRGLFIVYQLLSLSKAMSDRGLSLGMLTLQDIYMSENLWLQVLPVMMNNIHCLDASLIYEQRSKQSPVINTQNQGKKDEFWRTSCVQLEKLCMLWVRGRISNLDYLLHLNVLAGRSSNDPQAHFMVPWVTDFTSRCGRNWRDLTKSKYRLNKGDRQLDMTYDVSCKDQIPHHVSDALSDITCYVYLARRTPKEVLCKHVRNNWVPAEYPASIQRMQEWTPDECIPEFYTDPIVFKSIHEDLPDLGVPSWATCAEDFITKHREALESSHVSENLHHWIDITFGYKLSGSAAIKAKNVCLSLVDGHTNARRGGAVQLLTAPHPPRASRGLPPAPPRLHWTSPRDSKKIIKNDSSDDVSEDEEESTSLPQHVSRLHVPPQRVRSRHKSSNRARSLSKIFDDSPQSHSIEGRASSHSRHYRVQRSELGKGVIYLPKEFNPVASIQALEALDNFRTKCFLTKAEDKEKHKENISTLNLYPVQPDIKQNSASNKDDDNAFTNHMFLASYEQSYLKKFGQDAHLDNVLKERKNRSFNSRYTTDAAIYKQFVTESRRQDMLVIGCLIVEIFLHTQMRPLRTSSDNFLERFNTSRTVLKHNFNVMPKCVSYIASLLLNVQPPSLSFKNELSPKKDDPLKKIVVTDKGLPAPTPSQLLQPLLMQHLIPFPQKFSILYNLLSTLHEYELTSNELNILYMYECDGIQCEKYQNVDKTKLFFTQKIAEGKIQACAAHLDVILNQVNNSQFDVLDIFLAHYIELLQNKDTSVLAAWYLFDTVSKALGPAKTRSKLLKHILNLYEDDDYIMDKTEHKLTEIDVVTANGAIANKQKFAKLYHNIFLLQLMVRLGLQCFLDNFTQHLVEAVGGYKDVNTGAGSPGHLCHHRSMANKKPRYSDDNVKNALTTNNDIFSPDTSYGSEHVATPNVDKTMNDSLKDKDADSRSENELFHFETDKERLPSRNSRSKSPAESIDSFNSSNATQENNANTPSPSIEYPSPSNSKFLSKEPIVITTDGNWEAIPKKVLSPTIEIPTNSMFTSYIHFTEGDEEVELRKESHTRQTKSLDVSRNIENHVYKAPHLTEEDLDSKDGDPCKISDMSSESLIWLAHRLGPVLTCRYITRNLLKMLTLCYIGKENLSPWETYEKDEFDEISIVKSKVVGDRNAMKVINCLTSIVAMYGEQLIIFQYLPHMSELIASCRKRLSAPLEGGVVACLRLIIYLIPYMSDVKIMEQLQDTFLKSILQPALRLASTSRSSYPSGAAARGALTHALAVALYALALRIGPEMSRKHLCTPPLQRFFLAFDKATGKTDNWPKQDDAAADKVPESEPCEGKEGFLEICRDGTTAEWRVQDGRVVRADLPDLPCSPPHYHDTPDNTALTAQEELLMVFDEELAYQTYTTFARLVGVDSMERSLKNNDTIRALCRKYERNHAISSPLQINRDKRFQPSLSDEPLSRRDVTPTKHEVSDHISSSNSFGSNVTLVGNRIDVASDACEASCQDGFEVVACKMDKVKGNRHLRGDWLIYWEHEIGRPDKESRFNLKQIKLQTFVGHSHSVKSLHCLDNESSFMSGSKDKTVKLWSLRNQIFSMNVGARERDGGLATIKPLRDYIRRAAVSLAHFMPFENIKSTKGDGNATTQCNWTYTGHKKGVLSLSFLESLRLAVSTDSVVHIWDPFMECVVSQLDHVKAPVSIVRALGEGSAAILAATGDALRVIDARAPHNMYELKVPMSASTFVRCMCVCESGAWVACGLASGHIAVVELRTGLPRAAWKAHDGEVLRLAAVDERRLFSSGLDQVTALWKADDGELIAHMKGTTEPVHCLSVYSNELITGTTNNRIGVHTSLGPDASFSSTKLRSDSFRGVLTCMAVLPLNRLLLLASDNGTISLLC